MAPKTWIVAIHVIYNFFMLWKCKYIRLLLQYLCFSLFIFFLTSFFSCYHPGFRPSPRTPSAKSPNKLETFSPDRFSGPRTPKKTRRHILRIVVQIIFQNQILVQKRITQYYVSPFRWCVPMALWSLQRKRKGAFLGTQERNMFEDTKYHSTTLLRIQLSKT